MEDFLKTYWPIIATVVVVLIAFGNWLNSGFKELRQKDSELKDLIHDIDKKLEKLDGKFIVLKEKDALQEATLSKLPELLPDIHAALVQLGKGKNK